MAKKFDPSSIKSRREFLHLAPTQGSRLIHGDHALICIFLRGGADTLNMFIPFEDSDYYRLRPTLAIKPPDKSGVDKNRSIKVNGDTAFHPRLAPLVNYFKEGRLAIIEGVGTDNESGSHFEAQDQMEHGGSFLKPEQCCGGGWLGRHLQTAGRSPLSAVAMATSLPESLRGAPAASAVTSLSALELKQAFGDKDLAQALNLLYQGQGLLESNGRNTVNLIERMKKMKAIPSNAADYPAGQLASGLADVAKLIKARVGLEVAVLDHGGWDTHFFQGAAEGAQAQNIGELASSIDAFVKDLGARRDYTILVFTEFGRRISENGSLGTDHGRGFSAFALGAGVKGGMHGLRPSLHFKDQYEEQEQFSSGPGGLAIAVDYRSVFAEVLGGLMGNKRLDLVFPNFKPTPIGIVEERV